MATEPHTFDPDGDLLLILSRPAYDDTDSNAETSAEETTNTPSESVARGGNGEDAAASGDIPQGTAGQTEADGVENETGTSVGSADHESVDDDGAPDKRKPDVAVHMLVSAKHMMLASPVFKAMLQHSTFKEGRKLSSTGTVEVPLLDDDPAPFKIILDIIHGRNKSVPRQINLQSLTSVSILVDKYRMAESVESFSDGWIDALKEYLPTKYVTQEDAQDVHRWLGISWVFGKDEEFKKMTTLVERGCYAALAEDIEEGLPIPDLIVDSISQKRQEALFELYGLIEETVRRYQRSEILCPRTDNQGWRSHCDSLLLGSLLKSATTLGIVPVPEAPYGDISFDEMTAKLYSLNVNAICDSINRPYIGGQYPKPAHGLKEMIQERIISLEERLSGLGIQDFKAKEKSPRPVVGV